MKRCFNECAETSLIFFVYKAYDTSQVMYLSLLVFMSINLSLSSLSIIFTFFRHGPLIKGCSSWSPSNLSKNRRRHLVFELNTFNEIVIKSTGFPYKTQMEGTTGDQLGHWHLKKKDHEMSQFWLIRVGLGRASSVVIQINKGKEEVSGLGRGITIWAGPMHH